MPLYHHNATTALEVVLSISIGRIDFSGVERRPWLGAPNHSTRLLQLEAMICMQFYWTGARKRKDGGEWAGQHTTLCGTSLRFQ
jgi:hypothetical protein